MAKIDINKAFSGAVTSENRKKTANNATSLMTGGVYVFDKSKLDIRSIPIEKIRPRVVNEFLQSNIENLSQSIKLYGLINPLSVVYHEEDDTYIISSGHRRYLALKQLHEQYPNDKLYSKVDCAVYEVTEDSFKLAQGLPYITPEQEEGIYRDSNLENRQLTYPEVARQIRYILKKFDDPDYVDRMRERAAEQGIVTRSFDYNKTKLIMSVLSDQNYDGWNKETIRQYLKIKDAGREDLLNRIENGEMAVYTAYKQVVEDQKQTRHRKTNKLSLLKKGVAAFVKEAEKREYSRREIEEINGLIRELQAIVEKSGN